MSKTFIYEYGFSSGNVVEIVADKRYEVEATDDNFLKGDRLELNGQTVFLCPESTWEYLKITPILPAEDWSKESLKELVSSDLG